MQQKLTIKTFAILYICSLNLFGMKNLWVFFLCTLVVIGCDNSKKQENVVAQEKSTTEDRISRKDIEDLRYDDYGLSQESREAIKDWQKYNEMIIQTENLKKNDLTFFTNEATLVRTFLNDLQAEIPKQLATNEIYARLTVVETAMLKLNSLINLSNIDKEDKMKAIKDYVVAVSNLNLLINNKFEFESNSMILPN